MKAHAISDGDNPLPEHYNDKKINRLRESTQLLSFADARACDEIAARTMAVVRHSFLGGDLDTKTRILLGSGGLNPMLEPLRSHGYDVTVTNLSRPSAARVGVLLPTVDIVLLDVTTSSRDILRAIQELAAQIGICDPTPHLLCFSTAHRNAQFVLAIEKLGARYARVGDAAMLHEAIDLLLADIDGLRRNGPCFHIIHRYTRDSCAPGEEVSKILFPRTADSPQLHLALSERLVFDLLGRHARTSFDARQIVSALRGQWFYRDHASNSGLLQTIKLRVPAVKVIIQRIRKAMSIKFAEAHLRIEPVDVLQSSPAVGTNRVLYRLNADIRVLHSRE